MRSNKQPCMDFMYLYEGGYVDHPRDPGGATNLGITLKTLGAWRKQVVTKQDVRNLSKIEATQIYSANYWDTIKGDVLPKGVDLMGFDIAVNMGPGRANKWLDQTNTMPPIERIKKLDALRLGFWRSLRTFPIFGKGWLRRESACMALALKMAAPP